MTEEQDNKIKINEAKKNNEPASPKSEEENITENDGSFSPNLRGWKLFLVIFCYIIFSFLSIYVVLQTCNWPKLCNSFLVCTPDNSYLLYFTFTLMLILLLVIRYLNHESIEYKARLVDESSVRSMLVEAKTVDKRLAMTEEEFKKKKTDLEEEVTRLRKMGSDGWIEYEVLSLNQMLIDFLKIDALIARARSTLAGLGEYAEDTSIDLDRRQYFIWEEKINGAIRDIEEKRKEKDTTDKDVDKCAEKLKAETSELFDTIADYEQYWGMGSAYMRGLYIYGVQAIFILIAMGLLPLYYGDETLGLFNWGVLGISGSIAAVLWGLRKSKLVEVGHGFARNEIWRSVTGTGLGFLAGILMYSMIVGGFLEGELFPKLISPAQEGFLTQEECRLVLRGIGRSIFWAIASGFCFETIFEKVRGTVGNV
jgi:hypothetical protein